MFHYFWFWDILFIKKHVTGQLRRNCCPSDFSRVIWKNEFGSSITFVVIKSQFKGTVVQRTCSRFQPLAMLPWGMLSYSEIMNTHNAVWSWLDLWRQVSYSSIIKKGGNMAYGFNKKMYCEFNSAIFLVFEIFVDHSFQCDFMSVDVFQFFDHISKLGCL